MTRIVAGVAGGRRLAVPRGAATRPTAERTREALFSSLESMLGTLAGRAFLDLYAGSGAVGLEAASRGAARVTLVEHHRPTLTTLRANVVTIGLPGVEVRADRVESLLAEAPESPYDVVFADPPYADPIDPVLAALAAAGWVGPGGVVVVERASRDRGPTWPEELVADRSRRYGDSTLWYGRRP